LKSYVPFLSLRYLWYHKVSSGLGILGVTLGVGLVIVVVGVMDGFQKRLKNSLIGNTAAVVLEPRYDVDAEALCEALKKTVPGVIEASPVVYTWSLLSAENSGVTESLPCRVVGIDARKEGKVSDLGAKLHHRGSRLAADGKTPATLRLIEGATEEEPFRVSPEEAAMNARARPGKQGLLLSRWLRDRLDVQPGDPVRLATGRRTKGKKDEFTYESEVFTVTGIFDSGDTEIDQMLLLMDRRDALSFFKDVFHQEVDEVRLLLADPDRCDEVKTDIKGREVTEGNDKKYIGGKDKALLAASLRPGGRVALRPLAVLTWKDKNARLLAAVENERGLLIVITSFSFLVVAFLIGSTQSMLVVEKTREIGVLRSLGASVAGTASVFLGNGLFIGAIGAAAGAAVGTGITSNIQGIADGIYRYFGVELFPRDIYRFDQIPIDVKGEFLLTICAGAVVFALLGALLPAVRAAMLDPVESLHHE
jgi:lipoprotein-releasing system permease protein